MTKQEKNDEIIWVTGDISDNLYVDHMRIKTQNHEAANSRLITIEDFKNDNDSNKDY